MTLSSPSDTCPPATCPPATCPSATPAATSPTLQPSDPPQASNPRPSSLPPPQPSVTLQSLTSSLTIPLPSITVLSAPSSTLSTALPPASSSTPSPSAAPPPSSAAILPASEPVLPAPPASSDRASTLPLTVPSVPPSTSSVAPMSNPSQPSATPTTPATPPASANPIPTTTSTAPPAISPPSDIAAPTDEPSTESPKPAPPTATPPTTATTPSPSLSFPVAPPAPPSNPDTPAGPSVPVTPPADSSTVAPTAVAPVTDNDAQACPLTAPVEGTSGDAAPSSAAGASVVRTADKSVRVSRGRGHTRGRGRGRGRGRPPRPTLSPPEPEPSEPERSNRNLTHADKRRICELHDANPEVTHGAIVDLFFGETGRRLERSTISRIVRKKELWRHAGEVDASRKRFGTPRYPAVESALFELVRHRSRDPAMRKSLCDEELMLKGREVATAIVQHMPSIKKESPNYAPMLRSFSGSRSWLNSFKKRWALSAKEDGQGQNQDPGRPLSEEHLRESYHLWCNRLNVPDTLELMSNWTRMEDMYFLDAMVLSTNALPHHAKRRPPVRRRASAPSAGAGGAPQDPQGATNSTPRQSADGIAPNGILPVLSTEGPPTPGSVALMTVPDHPPDALSTPSWLHSLLMTSSVGNGFDGEPSSRRIDMGEGDESPPTSPSSRDASAQPTNSGSAPDSAADDTDEASPNEQDFVVDDEGVAVIMLCTNGTGNDHRAPWMVGKAPIRKLGTRDGEVWRGCSVRYFHNSRGWLTSSLIHSWIKEFDESIDRSVILVSSLINMCDIDLLNLKYVTLLPVPRVELSSQKTAAENLTVFSHSPLHLGIEQSFRARYRSLVVERALKYMARKQPIKSLSLESSARLVQMAWRKVPSADVRKAWHSLHYVPLRFRRAPRRKGPSPTKRASSEELKRFVLSYKEALSNYEHADDIEVSNVQCCIDDISEYMWLTQEPMVFHPNGSVLEYVRCAPVPDCDDESDEEEPAKPKTPPRKEFPPIENAEEFMEVLNKGAEFMRSERDDFPPETIHWIGSLQVVTKRLCDKRRNEILEKQWGSSSKRARIS